MPSDVKLSLQRIGLVVGTLSAIAALLAAWVLLPYRVDAAEKRIGAVETKLETDHEILLEIRADMKALMRDRPRPQ